MPCSILLIVPSSLERIAIRQVLHQDAAQPFLCTEAATAAEGLWCWQQTQTTGSPFDLVLLDWEISEQAVVTLLPALQGSAEFLPLPVVILADPENQPAAQATVATGVQDVIPKAQAFSAELPALLTKSLTRFHLVQRLHANAVHFQSLAQAAPAMTWATGPDHQPIFFNEAWLQFTGATLTEALHGGWRAGIHPDDDERCWHAYTSAFAQQQPFAVEYRRRQHTGDYCWLLDRAGPRWAPDGAFLGYTGNCFDITANKAAEAAVQRNETKYRALFETTMDAIFIGATDGTYMDVNPAAAQLLGLPREQIIGAHYSTFIPPEFLAAGRDADRVIRATGHWLGDFPMRRSDGTVIWTEYRSHFDGQHVLGIARDVTARKQAEQALQAAHMRLQNILESITDAFYTLDREWRFTYLNPQAERYFGQPQADLLGRHLWDLFPGAVGSLFEGQYRRAMTEGCAVHFEGLSPVIQRWLDVHAYPSPDGLAIYFRDITSRREAEAALIARERQQAAVADLGQRALAVQDLQLLMAEAVQMVTETLEVEYCKLLERLPDGKGLLLRAGVGWRVGAVGHTVVSDGIYSQGGYALLQAEPVIVPDLRTETRFESPTLLHEHGVISGISCLIADQPGQPYGVLGAHTTRLRTFTVDDVNFLQAVANILSHALQRQRVESRLRELNATLEQRVAERTAELKRSNEELDRYAHVAAHDLQWPLRGIDHLVSWITEDAGAALPISAQEHLVKLRRRVSLMQRLLDDLLAYARVTRAHHPLEWVNTLQVVQDIIDLLAPAPGFRITIEGALLQFRTERVPLETVLRNLVGNAIKHHHRPSAGQIIITAQEQEAWVTFTVSDDGPGIDVQFHERIFQLFETLQPRDQVEGSGLGLALVRRLVESRGGSVGVASSFGHGAQFFFTWPKERNDE